MFHARYFFPVLAFVGPRNLMPHELRSRRRMLAFAQPRELFRLDWPRQSPLLREPALPFAVALLVSAPVILLLGDELFGVVHSRLTG